MIRSRGFAGLGLIAALCGAPPAQAAARLPALSADATRTSVSGLSSGAFMAVHYDVAFSASTIGVGVVAGGPYDCADVNPWGAVTCLRGAPSAALSKDAADRLSAARQIDPPSALARSRVYLFSGGKDSVVARAVVDATRDFYRQEGVPASAITYVTTLPAGHGFVSSAATAPCGVNAAPFMVRCIVNGAPYDQAGALLGQIYAPLRPRTPTAALSSRPVAFDQVEFTSLAADMATEGYVYIPAACRRSGGAGCATHVVFHGCVQSAGAAEAGDAVYRRAGFNEWADANRLIVLYPQLQPLACWDWVGLTGPDFQARSGRQLAAVRAMVLRLTGGR